MKRLLLIALTLLIAAPSLAECLLEADTAQANFPIGPFVDETDGDTVETALTITSSEVLILKSNVSSFVAKNDATSCTHRSNGWYTCPLDSTDTNQEGSFIVQVNESGALPVFRECFVVAESYFDLLDATTTLLTAKEAGTPLATTVASAPTSTTITLTAGYTNDDAYNYQTIFFEGGTEGCHKTITDYTGSTKTVTYDSACPFTVAASDSVWIYGNASGKAVEDNASSISSLNDISTTDVNAQVDSALADAGLDHWALFQGTADSGTTTTITDAALDETADTFWDNNMGVIVAFSGNPQFTCITSFDNSTDTLTVRTLPAAVSTEDYVIVPAAGCDIYAATFAAGAVDASAIAANAITSSEIADNAITANKIAADSIGASEIAADAIGASEVAADAIGASEVAADAIGASEIATDAIGSAEIAASAIGSIELAAGAITSSELDSTAVDEIWDEVAEDQGSTYTAREVLSLLLSEAMGTCTYTQGTRTWVCKDPSGTETRFTLVYGSELDGDRSTSTPAPVTP